MRIASAVPAGAFTRFVAPCGDRGLLWPRSQSEEVDPMLDVLVVVSVLALFALLGLAVKAVERL